MLPCVRAQGGPAPDEVFTSHPLAGDADPDGVTAVLAALAGFFLAHARSRPAGPPDPPCLPATRRASPRWPGSGVSYWSQPTAHGWRRPRPALASPAGRRPSPDATARPAPSGPGSSTASTVPSAAYARRQQARAEPVHGLVVVSRHRTVSSGTRPAYERARHGRHLMPAEDPGLPPRVRRGAGPAFRPAPRSAAACPGRSPAAASPAVSAASIRASSQASRSGAGGPVRGSRSAP